MAKDSIKLIEPKEEKDQELPELTLWDDLYGRPSSLADLDPDANQELADIEVTFLSLGDLAYLDQITETEITDNSISTPKLQAGSVEASKMSVGTLSSITADFGTMTSGEIIGAEIKTSTSGEHVELINDEIRIYDSGNDLRFKSNNGDFQFYNSAGGTAGLIFGFSGTVSRFTFSAGTGHVLTLESPEGIEIGGSRIDMLDDIDMNNNDISNAGNLEVNDGDIEISGDGFINLSRMSGSTASGTSGDRDGSMYYRTDDDVIRVLLNGTWKTISTV